MISCHVDFQPLIWTRLQITVCAFQRKDLQHFRIFCDKACINAQRNKMVAVWFSVSHYFCNTIFSMDLRLSKPAHWCIKQTFSSFSLGCKIQPARWPQDWARSAPRPPSESSRRNCVHDEARYIICYHIKSAHFSLTAGTPVHQMQDLPQAL